MKRLTPLISSTVLLIVLASPAVGRAREVREISTASELTAVFEKPVESLEVRLKPGVYTLSPTSSIDSTCGNCENPDTSIAITVGLRISGREVHITGPGDGSVVIRTGSGYGLFFQNCTDCALEGISVTGGVRDVDPLATDAAIVIKNSSVQVRNNRILDNIGDSTLVANNIVGVMGICGREGSKIDVTGNLIQRNSWDGIALYRGAEAHIYRNSIDGVDKARAKESGGGRGVGIGVTWDAKAVIEENLVKRYWKGIGIFVDAQATVRHNIVEDILTWGIALWDADRGQPVGFIDGNVVYNTGACGISITSSTTYTKPGRLIGNVIVHTAQNPKYDAPDYYCYQCALALHRVPDGFPIRENVFFDNRQTSGIPPESLTYRDVPHAEFLDAVHTVYQNTTGIEILRTSDFLRSFQP